MLWRLIPTSKGWRNWGSNILCNLLKIAKWARDRNVIRNQCCRNPNTRIQHHGVSPKVDRLLMSSIFESCLAGSQHPLGIPWLYSVSIAAQQNGKLEKCEKLQDRWGGMIRGLNYCWSISHKSLVFFSSWTSLYACDLEQSTKTSPCLGFDACK